jgi:hypothetical protein
MGRPIFQNILCCLSFDDKETSEAVTSVSQNKGKTTNIIFEIFCEIGIFLLT